MLAGEADQGRDPGEKELCSGCSFSSSISSWLMCQGWGREEQLLLWVLRGQEQPVRDSCTALEMVLLECVLFSHCGWDSSARPCEGNGSLVSHSLIAKSVFTL